MPRVTSRNFFKTKVESFQYDTLCNGVPKGTNSTIFAVFTPSSIYRKYKAKLPFFLYKMAVLVVDKSGQWWTQNSAVGLRKGYESRWVMLKTYAPIISSSKSTIHLNKLTTLNSLKGPREDLWHESTSKNAGGQIYEDQSFQSF